MVCVSRTRGNVAPPVREGHHANRISREVADRIRGRLGAKPPSLRHFRAHGTTTVTSSPAGMCVQRHPPDGLNESFGRTRGRLPSGHFQAAESHRGCSGWVTRDLSERTRSARMPFRLGSRLIRFVWALTVEGGTSTQSSCSERATRGVNTRRAQRKEALRGNHQTCSRHPRKCRSDPTGCRPAPESGLCASVSSSVAQAITTHPPWPRRFTTVKQSVSWLTVGC